MNKFYVKGTVFTSNGIIVFEERNIKKAIKKIKQGNKKYMIVHQKFIRKGKKNYWYKMALSGLSENKIEADYIKVGRINDSSNIQRIK